MKKFIAFSFVFSFLVIGVATTHASVCGDVKLNHPAYDVTDPVTLVVTTVPAVDNVSCGNGPIPGTISMSWGLTDGHTPMLKQGETATDIGGISYSCNINFGCYDLTKTDYYIGQMRSLITELGTKGLLNQFPSLNGWIGK